MKRTFLINPRSGAGFSPRRIEELEAFFTRVGEPFDARLTSSRDKAIAATRKALDEGAEQIVAVGGDGTINAVVNGFFEDDRPICPNACLAIANTGTGSDYYASVNEGHDVADWRQTVLRHTVRRVDVGRVRFAQAELGQPYFVNMASVGLIADIVRRKGRLPRRTPRALKYALPSVASLLASRPTPVRITLDDEQLESDILTVSIAKGTYAGGRMRFGNQVKPDDGRFEVTLFGRLTRLQMLWKFPKLYSGDLANEPGIEKRTASRVSIHAATPLPVEFDGEALGTTDIDVSLHPKSLSVCFPMAQHLSSQPEA